MTEAKNRMEGLFEPLSRSEGFNRWIDALKKPGVVGIYGPDDSQRAHLLSAMQHVTGRPLLVVSPNEQAAQRMVEDLGTLLEGRVRLLPPRDVSFRRAAASSRELNMRRIEALGDGLTGRALAIVAPADALLNRMMPCDAFRAHVFSLEEGQQMDPDALIERLSNAGYERVQMVEGRGQCARRGGIIDVFPVGGPNALRIEFFDDEIDSIRSFDVLTQRSISRRQKVSIYPASETLLTDSERERAAQTLRAHLSRRRQASGESHQQKLEETFGLTPCEEFLDDTMEEKPEKGPARRFQSSLERNFSSVLDAVETGRTFDSMDALLPVLLGYANTVMDYLERPVIVLDQPERIRDRCENRTMEFREWFSQSLEREEALPAQGELLFGYDEILSRMDGREVTIANPFLRTEQDFQPKELISFECRNATGYQSNVRELAADLRHWQEEGWQIALLAGGVARGERLVKALAELDFPATFREEIPDALEPGRAWIFPVAVNRGFLYPDLKFAVVSESDIYGVSRRKNVARARSGEKIEAFTELQVGDYVVHVNHGIGQYMGTVRLETDGKYRDYLHIRYQGSDKLYVPTDQLDRVQKYIGSEGEAPKLNRLSGGEWQRQKAKVRQSIQQIAGDLVKLYAKRQTVKGYAFDPDTPWQREFEESFPYEETPDQLAAIEDIKRDMESDRAMDRLLCGDVGYGKTEVALRAIFKAVMSGKQAAMLAPTTILVQQHYATMTNRFADFPIRLESLSRFKTAAEQRDILKRLAEGEIDVVVGTHRLLAKDVTFQNLGLLVVDEEQRFGVAHKEAIKKMRASVDVLTLTATPIPRTLHMSMVGIRDMSLLQSPPEERYPVQTYVVEYSDGLVRDAILREIGRGGQVYVLYNRVQTIEVMFARLKKLVPEARIAVGHGQMREHALEDVMLDFYEGKFDVLLCTTIIEAGLDVPRANTLIVCDADRFGLAQLYQLRGRVGRSNRLAYAYLTVNPRKVLTEAADRRLAAIREFTEFGSGFRVAMRDLEIRGAGNLLGAEQSGFMASVGYDLYVKMIEEAVHELRGDVSQGDIDTRMDIPIDAYLPQEYISNDLLRVEMYKKIASIRDDDSREDLVEELIDRFGDPARPVISLLDIAQLKSLCGRIGIDYVTWRNASIQMRFSISADIDLVRVLTAVRQQPNLKVIGGNPPSLVLPGKPGEPEAALREAIQVMGGVVRAFEEAGSGEEAK